MLDCLSRHYGIVRSGRVIQNGRSKELFQPGTKEPFVLTAGRLWDEAKNVKAMEVVGRDLSWPVYVAGEEEHPDGSRAECGNVCPLGRLSTQAISQWYARASIYALPARYEPFGLTVLEAALAECALVLGDIPSLREIWGDTALFVPPEDTMALKDALERLIDHAPLRRALAAKARTRALEFTPDRMALGYLEAYKEMMRR
jgi:glycosyltransferase involved in cell wall biosynthesis